MTTAATTTPIAEKIAKLLALAEGTTHAEEAQSALAMARKLMLAHRVEQDAVDKAAGRRREVKIVDVIVLDPGAGESSKHREAWVEELWRLLAENFRCARYCMTKRGGGLALWVMGHEEDVAICRAAFAAAHALCYREGWRWTKKQWYRNRPRAEGRQQRLSWCQGFVKGLADKLALERKALTQCEALALVTPEDVKAKHAALVKGGRSVGGVAQARAIGAAYSHGYTTGKSFDPMNRTSLAN